MIIYFVLSQNKSLLICPNRKFGFLVVFIQGLQVSVMDFRTSDTKGCQLYFYRPSQSNFIVLMEHHIEVMVLTVFKNFTWMSKNGVNLKKYGSQKIICVVATRLFHQSLLQEWWARADSNCRPHDYQSCALTN